MSPTTSGMTAKKPMSTNAWTNAPRSRSLIEDLDVVVDPGPRARAQPVHSKNEMLTARPSGTRRNAA